MESRIFFSVLPLKINPVNSARWWPQLLLDAQVQSLHKELKTAEVMMLSDVGSDP